MTILNCAVTEIQMPLIEILLKTIPNFVLAEKHLPLIEIIL